MATSTYRAVWSLPGSCWVLLVLGMMAACGPLVAQAEDTITVLEDRPLLDMVLPDDTMPDERAADGPTLLAEPEEVVARESISPEFMNEVSARAADGLRVQDFEIEEMPFEVSSGKWFSSGQWYGSAEVLMMSRSRNYRRVMGYDPSVVGLPNPSLRPNLAGTFVTTGIPWDLVPGARLTIGEHLDRDRVHSRRRQRDPGERAEDRSP